mgnify:CR=1 FL=1
MKKDILDLRFIIGLFFAITGVILLIASLTLQTTTGKSETTNFWSGIFYIVFGVFVILLWNFGKTESEMESAHDENE